MKPLRPFFKYFGSKHRIVKRYPKPQHQRIVEPFAGSASYSLHYWDREITLVDLDMRVCRLWAFLIGATPETIMGIPLLEQGQRVDSLGLAEGPDLLLRCLVNSSPWRQALSKWKGDSRPSVGFWGEHKRDVIASQVDKIKHWKVLHASYREIRTNPNSTTWFIDPPYEGMSQHYKEGKGLSHEHLANWCKAKHGQVIVCEKGGAEWLPFEPLVMAKTARHKKTLEVFWHKEAHHEEGR